MDHFPDTPCHIGYVKKKPNDSRRHKSYCIYYENHKCICNGGLRCMGSAHCSYYTTKLKKPNKPKEEHKPQEVNPKKHNLLPGEPKKKYKDRPKKKADKKKRIDLSKSYNGISVNHRVSLLNLSSHNRLTIDIVTKKTDYSENIVSIDSPIGQKLIGRHIGDTLTIRFKDDEPYELKILNYEELRIENS